MSEPERDSIEGIVGGLMVAENMGDVHDEFRLVCWRAGVPEPEGDFINGFSDEDRDRVARAIKKVAAES